MPTYNFNVTIRDDLDRVATSPQSLYVDPSAGPGPVKWWLMNVSPDGRIWVSDDPADWSAAQYFQINPASDSGNLCRYIQINDSAFRTSYTSPNSYITRIPIVDLTGTNGDIFSADVYTMPATWTATQVRVYGGIGLVVRRGTAAASTYLTTEDDGMTWTERTLTGAYRIHDIQRLPGGRWVAFYQTTSSASSARMAYSDDADAPVTWSTPVAIGSGWSELAGVSGDRVLNLNTTSRLMHWTDDGITLNSYPLDGVLSVAGNVANSSGVVLVTHDNTVAIYGDSGNYPILMSWDNGVTWTKVTASTVNINSLAYGGGYWMAAGDAAGAFYVSADDGATFTTVTKPTGAGGSGAQHMVVPMRMP